tara:strand:+ start:733 stop:1380 length:648 start_codon:yes stop_codon:yes gene_type:complete
MGANVKILNDVFNGGKSVASISFSNYGTGYTSTPTVAFSAPVAGTTATGTVVLGYDTGSGAPVDSITITDVGEGYVTAPTVTFTGGGGSAAAATAVLTTNADQSGYTHALVSFYNGGVAMTVDASDLRGMYNGTNGFKKFTITNMEWSVDSPVNVSFTGTGVTDATNVNYTGSFDHSIPNGATQPGDATNPDIVITPVSGIDGYVYLNLLKTDYV